MITLTCIAQVSHAGSNTLLISIFQRHQLFKHMQLVKPHSLFPATFMDGELVLAVQIANIACFRARSTSYICSI